MPVLRAITGDIAGEVYPLLSNTLIGRHDVCQVRLANRAVSRKHAMIREDGGRFWIEDLGSRNRTRVNDAVLDKRLKLSNGDRISICHFEFQFDAADGSEDSRYDQADSDLSSTGIRVKVETSDPADHSSIISRVDMSKGYDARRLANTPVERLAALMEIVQNLNQSRSLAEGLPRILRALLDLFPYAQRGVIMRRTQQGTIEAVCVKTRDGEPPSTLQFSRQVIDLVMNTRQAVLSTNLSKDGRFSPDSSLAQMKVHSLICAPQLGGNGEVLGAIELDATEQGAAFDNDDLNTLATVALQTGLRMDNFRLRQRSIRDIALVRDLKLARQIQVKFLPLYPPKIENLAFFDFYQPAIEVGGDIYDYVPLPGNRLAVVVADIVGHGVVASLLMAKLSAEIRFSLALEPSLSAAVGRMNRSMCDIAADKFATLAVCLIDLETLSVSIANAGHQPPVRRRKDGTVEDLGEEVGGLPLGILNDEEYDVFEAQLNPGDMLVLMTDGIWECSGDKDEAYGLERFNRVLAASHGSADATGEVIIDSVHQYTAGGDPEDDMCLVCVQCLEVPVA